MTEEEIQQKAAEMVEEHLKLINQEVLNLQNTMKEAGLSPDKYIICHNLKDIAEGKTNRFEVWAELK